MQYEKSYHFSKFYHILDLSIFITVTTFESSQFPGLNTFIPDHLRTS